MILLFFQAVLNIILTKKKVSLLGLLCLFDLLPLFLTSTLAYIFTCAFLKSHIAHMTIKL